jgi:hypothetical protein
MHPHLFSLTGRLALFALVCCALTVVAAWSVVDTVNQGRALRPQIQDIQPASLPEPEAMTSLLDAASWTNGKASKPAVRQVDPTLLGTRGGQRDQTRLGMILHNTQTPVAMIDGRVVRKGEVLPDGRIVQDITAHGVILLTPDKAELVVWTPPLEVRLEKPTQGGPKASADKRAAGATLDPDLDRLEVKPGQVMQVLRQFASPNPTN